MVRQQCGRTLVKPVLEKNWLRKTRCEGTMAVLRYGGGHGPTMLQRKKTTKKHRGKDLVKQMGIASSCPAGGR